MILIVAKDKVGKILISKKFADGTSDILISNTMESLKKFAGVSTVEVTRGESETFVRGNLAPSNMTLWDVKVVVSIERWYKVGGNCVGEAEQRAYSAMKDDRQLEAIGNRKAAYVESVEIC